MRKLRHGMDSGEGTEGEEGKRRQTLNQGSVALTSLFGRSLEYTEYSSSACPEYIYNNTNECIRYGVRRYCLKHPRLYVLCTATLGRR